MLLDVVVIGRCFGVDEVVTKTELVLLIVELVTTVFDECGDPEADRLLFPRRLLCATALLLCLRNLEGRHVLDSTDDPSLPTVELLASADIITDDTAEVITLQSGVTV